MCVNVMLPKIVYFFSFKMFEVHVFQVQNSNWVYRRSISYAYFFAIFKIILIV